MIVAGRSLIDLSPLTPGRFESKCRSEEELREACRLQYAQHYWETPAKEGARAAQVD